MKICKYCGRELVNAGALTIHEKHCNENPNRVQRIRSPKAGAQKGFIPWNKGIKTGRHKNYDVNYSIEKTFTENSTYPRHCLKRRIIKEKLLEYKCPFCGNEGIWLDKPMPLILDHINGVNNDHRLENLRFVCSNCDSQLPTYKSRNIKKK